MKEVTILLSTYNGEKYLEEQLESIMSQKGVSTKIIVRDDGSCDRTCDILAHVPDMRRELRRLRDDGAVYIDRLKALRFYFAHRFR